MDNLQAEIYYRILGHLDKCDIFSFSLVFKRVHGVANEVHNKTWIINDRKTIKMIHNKITYKYNTYFKNRHFVRKLVFESDWSGKVRVTSGKPRPYPVLTQTDFLALLDSLPYIEEIDISRSHTLFHGYIYLLSFANLQRIKKITVQTRDVQARHLRISFTSFPITEYHQYFSTCFKFRNTLTSLYYQHLDNLNELRQLKNLTHLEFNIQHGDGMIIFQILELYPQLIDFKFNHTPINSQRVTRRWLDQSIEPIKKSNKSLQYLEISLPSLSINYTKCLTSYLAEGLHTVSVSIKSTSFYSWIEEVGMESALKLMKNLGLSKEANICFSRNGETRTTNFNNEVRITQWWQFMNAFNESKKASCTLRIFGYGLPRGYCTSSCSSKQLKLDYGIDIRNISISEDQLYNFIKLLSEFNLPSRSISTIGPETFNHLELDFYSRNTDNTLKFLKYVFTNFINLQYFKMQGYLEIRGHKGQKVYKTHDIQNNMTIVEFPYSVPVPKILDTISTYFPNISTLVIEKIRLCHNITDLTTFKNLKRCYFIDQITPYHRMTYIKFKYSNETEKFYSYNTKFGYSRTSPLQSCLSSTPPNFTFIYDNDTEAAVRFHRWDISY